ncbi:BhlA/UviB family holin-like peptide [Priestia megaterium]|uniref:BhlA/UviB family holin-like peptide n=1 Tax=Priestia megaterium TaxID=1404 RepID=UPI0020D22AFA|nr:BhlA/UviB family holin-like peptide [Priestia megaterium]
MLDIILMVVQGVDLNAMWDILVQNGIFAVLFGWLFWDTRKEAKVREEKLMNHIEKQGDALDRITDTMGKMDVRLTHIEGELNTKK